MDKLIDATRLISCLSSGLLTGRGYGDGRSHETGDLCGTTWFDNYSHGSGSGIGNYAFKLNGGMGFGHTF